MTNCKTLFLVQALSCATLSSLFAGGVRVTDPLIGAFASRPITIDGSLDDWPEARSSRIVAFPSGSSESVQSFVKYPALGKGQAEVMMTHNGDNLYLGLRLAAVDAVVNTATAPESWHSGGDGIIVNARDADGKSFAVLWWGVDDKGAPRVAVRRDGGAWKDSGTLGGQAAMRSAPGKGSTVEILIPWSALGRTDAGTPRLDLVWEAAFNGITLDVLKDLPQEMRRVFMHSSRSVLTVPERQGTMIWNWLSNPAQWGKLRFGDAQARPGATLETARGVGISEWTAPLTSKPLTIDGKLEDWPKEWLVSAAPAPWAYGDRYRTDIGVAWDAETLYLVFRYHNNGQPMHNTEITANQMGFAGGDNTQIRLKIGEKVTHLCGWYDSKNQISALTADGKEHQEPNLLAAGARQAFAVLPDGSGYVQEIAIPFKALNRVLGSNNESTLKTPLSGG